MPSSDVSRPKRKRLTKIDLIEVSLVDDPANEHARVELWKRRDAASKPEEDIMSDDAKKLEAVETELQKARADLASAVDARSMAEDRMKKIEKAAKDAGFEISEEGDKVSITKAKEPEMIEINGTKVEKALVPAPVLEALAETKAEITKIREAREKDQMIAFAKANMNHLPGDENDHVELAKAVHAVSDETARGKIIDLLKSADAISEKALFSERGSAGEDEATPAAKLDALARDFAKANKVTFAKAFDTVTQSGEGKALFAETRKTAN